MNPNGKEADDMGTLVEISSHPRFTMAERELERIVTDHKTAAASLERTVPAPPPSEESVYLSCAETAKLVRAALKKAFPGIKFSVISHVYSMGASIRVKWHDGPEPADVSKVARAFAGATFDGMTDSTIPYTHWLLPDGSVVLASNGGGGYGGTKINTPKPSPDAKKVHFGANYIFCDRHWKEA